MHLTGGAVTTTAALAESSPALTVMRPLPRFEPAVKTVDPPALRESLPSDAGASDHVADATEAGLPKASAPLAENARERRAATEVDRGETLSDTAGPATTVCACVPPAVPRAVAVNTGLPAEVSS
jgi:hypothetical protein